MQADGCSGSLWLIPAIGPDRVMCRGVWGVEVLMFRVVKIIGGEGMFEVSQLNGGNVC